MADHKLEEAITNAGKQEIDESIETRVENLKAQLEEAVPFLLENGYVVLKGVLLKEEVDTWIRLFKQFYEESSIKKDDHPLLPKKNEGESEEDYQKRIKPFKQYLFDDPATHRNKLVALHGILKNYMCGQAECQWYLRTLPIVCWLFSMIHGTDQLFTSFDGMCYYRDTTLRPERGSWLHDDLHPKHAKLGHKLKTWFGLQAQFCMTDGHHLRVVPGSHLVDRSEGVSGPIKHWFKPMNPDKTRPKGFRNEDSIVLEANAGDAILWFSNTTHAGTKLDIERMTAYVCMHPKSHLTPADIKRMEKIFRENRSTDHWGRGMNGKNPQTYGDPKNDATLLVQRQSGGKLFMQSATEEQKRRVRIFALRSKEGLVGGYSADPLVKITSLDEGKKLLAGKKRTATQSTLQFKKARVD